MRFMPSDSSYPQFPKTYLTVGCFVLSLQAKTPEQWEASTKNVDKSPACRGGFGL